MQHEEIGRLRKENDTLRAIAAKIMPCMYCGVDSIAKCPRGFPGCGLADDVFCYQDTLATALIVERKRVEKLEKEQAVLMSDLASATFCIEQHEETIQNLTAILESAQHVLDTESLLNSAGTDYVRQCKRGCLACAFEALKKGEGK